MKRVHSRKDAQKPTSQGVRDHRNLDMHNIEDIKKWVGGNEQ